jgi:hypothetical protein
MAVGIQEDDQLDDAQLEVRFAQRAVHGGPSRPSKAWRPIVLTVAGHTLQYLGETELAERELSQQGRRQN